MTDTLLDLMKSVSIPKTSTDCITFRIPVEKMNRLRRESVAKGVSLNTSINHIISEYLNWHRMAAPAKLYYLPKPFLISHQLRRARRVSTRDCKERSGRY